MRRLPLVLAMRLKHDGMRHVLLHTVKDYIASGVDVHFKLLVKSYPVCVSYSFCRTAPSSYSLCKVSCWNLIR